MKKAILITSTLIVLLILTLAFLLRADFVSDKVKTYAIAELENATKHRIKIEKTTLNLIPIFIEFKGIELLDDQGRSIITIKRARGYIGLGRLLQRELRITVKVIEPYFTIERYEDGTFNLFPLLSSVQGYLKEEKKAPLELDFKGLSAEKGEIYFFDKKEPFSIHGKGISFNLRIGLFRQDFGINTEVDELRVKIGSLPDLLLKAEAKLKGKERLVKIEELRITNIGSSIGVQGYLNLSFDKAQEKSEGAGVDLKTRIILTAKSFKEFFGFKSEPSGEITISGDIKGDLPMPENKVFPDIDLELKADMPISLIKSILSFAEGKEVDIEGAVRVKADLKGKYPEVIAKGNLSLSEGEIYGIKIDKIESEFILNQACLAERVQGLSKRLTFSEIKGHVLEGMLEGKIMAFIPDIPRTGLTQMLQAIRGDGWIRYTKRAEQIPPLPHAKGISLSMIDKAEIIFSSKGGYLKVEKGNINTRYSTSEFSGDLSLKTLEGKFRFYAHSDNFGEWVDPYYSGTKGVIDIKGEMSGPIKEPALQGSAEISSTEVKGVAIQRAYGDVGYRNKELSVSGFRIEQEKASYLLDGKIKFDTESSLSPKQVHGQGSREGPFYDARLKIKNGNPRKITSIFYRDLPIDTSFNGEINLRGGHRDYEGEALITLDKGKAYGQDFDKARIKATLKKIQGRTAEISFPSIQIERRGNILYAEGRIGFDESFYGTISSKRIDLRNITILNSFIKGGPEGFTSLRITAKGTFEMPEIIANLKLEKISYRESLFGDGNMDISLKDATLHVSLSTQDSRLTAKGEMILREDLPWNGAIFMRDARLEDFLTQGGEIPAHTNSGKVSIITTGSIKAEGRGTDPKRLSVNASLNTINLNINGYKVHNDGDAKIGLKGRDLKVHSLRFKDPQGSVIEIGGELRIKGFYDLYLYGKADIGILKSFIPQIETLNGDGEFMVALSDRWQDPMIQGMINFKEGSLKIKDFPQRIGKLSGTLSFEKDRLILDSLQGELGGGRFDFSGFATLKGLSLKNFYLHGNAEGVSYRYFEGFTATFDGTLSYEGDTKAQSLSGEITLRRTSYSRRIDWKSWLLEVRKIQERGKAEVSPLLNTDLNIHLSGNIDVDNNIGEGPVGIDLLLKGTPLRPLLFGRVESTEGKIFFRNNSFRVISATADFFDPNRIYPIFNIVAETELKGYRIHLSLSGNIDRFSLSLSSDPPLSETDLLALLTVGQPLAGLQGLEAGIGASEAASFLTGKIQDVFEERFRRITGVDRFQVDPYVMRSSVAGGPRLTVGKSLLDGNLYMTYSANIGTSEEQVLRVEYKLGKNVSLIGVRDEQGQVGGDLKFRFEFR